MRLSRWGERIAVVVGNECVRGDVCTLVAKGKATYDSMNPCTSVCCSQVPWFTNSDRGNAARNADGITSS